MPPTDDDDIELVNAERQSSFDSDHDFLRGDGDCNLNRQAMQNRRSYLILAVTRSSPMNHLLRVKKRKSAGRKVTSCGNAK